MYHFRDVTFLRVFCDVSPALVLKHKRWPNICNLLNDFSLCSSPISCERAVSKDVHFKKLWSGKTFQVLKEIPIGNKSVLYISCFMLQNSTVLILQLGYFVRFPQLLVACYPRKVTIRPGGKKSSPCPVRLFLHCWHMAVRDLAGSRHSVGGILASFWGPTSRPSCWDFFAVIFLGRVYKFSFNYEESLLE